MGLPTIADQCSQRLNILFGQFNWLLAPAPSPVIAFNAPPRANCGSNGEFRDIGARGNVPRVISRGRRYKVLGVCLLSRGVLPEQGDPHAYQNRNRLPKPQSALLSSRSRWLQRRFNRPPPTTPRASRTLRALVAPVRSRQSNPKAQ